MNTHPLIPDDDDVNSVLASGVFTESPVDLSRFRNEKGEFKKWLQVFYLETERKGKPPFLRVTHALPWLHSDDTIDLEFHQAASALGAYDKYPLVWRSMRWNIKPHSLSPHWAMFTVNTSRDALNHSIGVATQFSCFERIPWDDTRFWKALERHVLVPSERDSITPRVWTHITTEK